MKTVLESYPDETIKGFARHWFRWTSFNNIQHGLCGPLFKIGDSESEAEAFGQYIKLKEEMIRKYPLQDA